jgi:hypothetical protein
MVRVRDVLSLGVGLVLSSGVTSPAKVGMTECMVSRPGAVESPNKCEVSTEELGLGLACGCRCGLGIHPKNTNVPSMREPCSQAGKQHVRLAFGLGEG